MVRAYRETLVSSHLLKVYFNTGYLSSPAVKFPETSPGLAQHTEKYACKCHQKKEDHLRWPGKDLSARTELTRTFASISQLSVGQIF